MSKLSPIVLFVYNRPNHTKLVLDALSINPEACNSDLIIYCDGPKLNATEFDIINIKLTRQVVNLENRFLSVEIIERESNLGLSNSIINGVTEVVNKYGKIIVLEDDIVPSSGFLSYMNNALEVYKEDQSVGCIHAWNYKLNIETAPDTTFFLKGGDCWGWATWAESWHIFNPDGSILANQIVQNGIKYKFNRNGTQPFFEMLIDQINKKNDSWAIRWYATLYLKDIYCLHPVSSLVLNIGFDNTGTHCGYMDIEQNTVNQVIVNKIKVQESKWFFKEYSIKYQKPLFKKVIKKLLNYIKHKQV
jgi:hypothetical protein